MSNKRNHQGAIMGLVLISMLWSFSFICGSKIINSGVTSEVLLFARFGVGALFLGIINIKSLKKISKADLIGGIIAGLCILFAIYFQNIALKFTTVSKISFISSMNIIIVPFLAYFINKAHIRKKHILGLLISVVSICFLSLDFNDLSNVNIGDVFCIMTATGLALQLVVLKKYAGKTNPGNLTFIHACVVCLGGLIICLFTHPNYNDLWQGLNIYYLLYLGIIAVGFCYSMQAWCSKYVGEVLTCILLASQSIFGSIFDILIFHTTITYQLLVGGLLMLLAIYVLVVPRQYLPFYKQYKKKTSH
ncbi:MAG: DMT family transporter [Bacilli bacterium]|jgi:drug/metabolite transporter (DMT)-like permease|nr:DMT family transporter [Bacilli bacterium]